jgi:putative glutamine amidotransferase
MMRTVHSWVRECDEANFGSFFAGHADLQLVNARRESVDATSADALLLTGGADIAEKFLRQPVPDASVLEPDADPARDAWEFAALRSALERGLPVLAVCKGAQVLNVALGGTLHLDIRGHNLPEQKYQELQPLRFASTPSVRFERVNSAHHQALDRLGDGLEVEAWSAEDGIIEQVRLRGRPYVLGVQYHPERGAIYAPLFEQFFAEIRRRA